MALLTANQTQRWETDVIKLRPILPRRDVPFMMVVREHIVKEIYFITFYWQIHVSLSVSIYFSD